jgi:hypothetical protein
MSPYFRGVAVGAGSVPVLMLLVFHSAVSRSNPDWDTALLASRISLASGLIAIGTAIVALAAGRLSRNWKAAMGFAISLGFAALILAGFVEILARSCLICVV